MELLFDLCMWGLIILLGGYLISIFTNKKKKRK